MRSGFRYILAMMMGLALVVVSCEDRIEPQEQDNPQIETPSDSLETEEPQEPGTPVEQIQPKKVSLWISTSVNFNRLKTKSGIRHFMDLIEDAGFNEIIVEVKTMQGKAMYFSDILEYQTEAGGVTVERDWDYLQYFIDQAHERGMTVLAASRAAFSFL